MSVFQGDFLGFLLGNEHSYGINITRVSSNDRYTDILLPNFTDAVAQVPGGDGTYYWDTYYTLKIFTIEFAYDNLRDEDIRKLRQMFSYKTVLPLIFDEYPYKKYMVKCQLPPLLRYICFDEYEFRIYKGEGTVQLIAYYPFAFSVNSPYIPYKLDGAAINNTGDLPANIKILYNLSNISDNLVIDLRNIKNTESFGHLELSNITTIGNDSYILINTLTQLIEGLNNNKQKTKNLYNSYISKGDFFWPPVGRSMLISNQEFENASYTPLYY